MRHILGFIIAMLISNSALAGDNRFFETLYDVPVMEGLVEVADMALIFDKTDGRISEAGAITQNVSEDEIVSFYNEALGQMGWKPQTGGVYTREGEILQMAISPIWMTETVKNPLESDTSLLVRFTLKPQ